MTTTARVSALSEVNEPISGAEACSTCSVCGSSNRTTVERTAWTVHEFAQSMGGMHPDTVKRLLRSGELRGFKVNGRWLISEEARREFVAKKEHEAAEELGLAS